METRPAYIHFGQDSAKTICLQNLSVIGSDENAVIRITDPNVDARVARIEHKHSYYYLRDLRSNSTLLLNGKPIIEAYLQEGDVIQIHEAEMVFSYQENLEITGVGLRSRNEKWNQELQTLGSVAESGLPVLLLGPSGTGKEVLAEAIHKNSKRSDGPFVSVNCCALSETLIESELFGHVKGAYTGANGDRKGAFESARKGTLFLDEIGDLPYGLQAKLLRALENSEIRPVGADFSIKTNTRIIAATHQNLQSKIHSGEFRADLYYRLAVISISPPALAQRMEDFDEIMTEFCKQYKVRFSFGAIQRLKKHSWPGNIRELKNTIARASALFPKIRIEETQVDRLLDSVPARESTSQNSAKSGVRLSVIKEIEREMIIKRLAANNGNQKQTALDLGMPKSTLHDRLKVYNINSKNYTPEDV